MKFSVSLLWLMMIVVTGCNNKIHSGRAASTYTLGTYATPPRINNKNVDITKLITELKELNVNTYNWLIWQHTSDWEDLKLFLPEAAKHHIKVWVTVVPPSESKPKAKWNSEPFGMDYIKWAREIAKLSLQYKNLIAWSIDDFAHNLNTYTPEYLQQMLSAASNINAGLQFIPCLYYRQINESFANKYGALLSGILFPYRAESKGANLQDATAVKNEIENIRKLFKKGLPVYIDVYLTAHSRLGASTPQYVHDVMVEGKKYADGVLIYTHPNPVTNAEKYKVVKEGFAK